AAAGCGVGRSLALGALGDGEGMPAAARSGGIWVLDLEPGLLDRLEIVDASAHEIRRTEGVDDDRDALTLELVVALLGAAVEAEAVLETRAPAALDRDAKDGDVLLSGEERVDLRGRRGGEGDDALGALDGSHAVMVPTQSVPKTGGL